MDTIASVIKNTLTITSFVFVMMLVIEYVNVLTRGTLQSAVSRYKSGQSVLSAFLGAIPGCLGSFAVGSLYIHRVITFGALTAAMIATCGDEAFVMLAMFPDKALLIITILFGVGVASGILVDIILQRKKTGLAEHLQGYKPVHDDEDQCVPFSRYALIEQWKKCSAHRGWLVIFLLLFLLGIAFGEIGHEHGGEELTHAEHYTEMAHGDDDGHEEELEHAQPSFSWDWVKFTLIVAGIIGLLIVATVPDHFLEEHLWRHLVKIHLWRIFLWTLGALLLTHLLLEHIDLKDIITKQHLIVLLVACLIGFIPESGPHLIFVTLFAQGMVPFSILLASCVVQDGHGMLPLLAHSRRAFLGVKAVNFLIGLLIGLIGFFTGW